MKTSHRSSDSALRRKIAKQFKIWVDTSCDSPCSGELIMRAEKRFKAWIFSQIKAAEVRGRASSDDPLKPLQTDYVGNPLGPGLPVSVGSSENRCPQCDGELEGRRCPKCQVTWYTEEQKKGWLKKSLANE